MNEISLHRGRSPHLTSVDAYVDGQHLTAAVVSAVPILATFLDPSQFVFEYLLSPTGL